MLGQQVFVDISFRFDLLDSAGDDDAVEQMPNIVLFLEIGDRRGLHIGKNEKLVVGIFDGSNQISGSRDGRQGPGHFINQSLDFGSGQACSCSAPVNRLFKTHGPSIKFQPVIVREDLSLHQILNVRVIKHTPGNDIRSPMEDNAAEIKDYIQYCVTLLQSFRPCFDQLVGVVQHRIKNR